jgi:hypothetical protein
MPIVAFYLLIALIPSLLVKTAVVGIAISGLVYLLFGILFVLTIPTDATFTIYITWPFLILGGGFILGAIGTGLYTGIITITLP